MFVVRFVDVCCLLLVVCCVLCVACTSVFVVGCCLLFCV